MLVKLVLNSTSSKSARMGSSIRQNAAISVPMMLTQNPFKQLLAYGFFIEADLPSPLMGYPGALGLDLSAQAGDSVNFKSS